MSVEEKETSMAYETVTLQTLLREIAGRTSSNQGADAIRMAADTLDAFAADVRRDEAVRAAEDAAAVPSIQHRDLPEQVALVWASLGDLLGRVVRLEGEMDAGQEDSASPVVCDSAHLDANRGESVRVVEESVEVAYSQASIDRLTAERDAAIRERDEARARVAVLEAALPPRGWLTAEEREVVSGVRDHLEATGQLAYSDIVALDAILARETPPRVKRRGPWTINGVPGDGSQAWKPMIDAILSHRDDEWIAAIRAAGGEVADE